MQRACFGVALLLASTLCCFAYPMSPAQEKGLEPTGISGPHIVFESLVVEKLSAAASDPEMGRFAYDAISFATRSFRVRGKYKRTGTDDKVDRKLRSKSLRLGDNVETAVVKLRSGKRSTVTLGVFGFHREAIAPGEHSVRLAGHGGEYLFKFVAHGTKRATDVQSAIARLVGVTALKRWSEGDSPEEKAAIKVKRANPAVRWVVALPFVADGVTHPRRGTYVTFPSVMKMHVEDSSGTQHVLHASGGASSVDLTTASMTPGQHELVFTSGRARYRIDLVAEVPDENGLVMSEGRNERALSKVWDERRQEVGAGPPRALAVLDAEERPQRPA